MTETLTKDQIFIRKLTEIIKVNLQNENFGVTDLARESGMSLYAIGRKLYSINNKRVSQFIREVRLRKAMELLQNGTFTASEVSYKVGFGSPAYFNKCFREFFGCTPGDIKNLDVKTKVLDIIDQIEGDDYRPVKSIKWNSFYSLVGILFLICIPVIAGFLIYKKMQKTEWPDDLVTSNGRISLAVMPFRNMTNDTTLNEWEEGIQQILISSLSDYKDLEIRHKESVNTLLQSGRHTDYSSISTGIAGKISRKLVASLFIYGSIEKDDNEVRIDAQLIDTKTKEVFKSFNVKKPAGEKNFFQVIDTISQDLTSFLIISKLIKENPVWGRFPLSTNSPEALKYSIKGLKAREKGDFQNAISWYSMSLSADSDFIDAAFGLENAYAHSGNFDASKKLLIRNYNKRDSLSTYNKIYASYAYVLSFEAPESSVKYLRQLQQLDDQWPRPTYLLGIIYNWMGQYYNAITEFEKLFTLYKRWGKDYMKNNFVWEGLGLAYHKTGQYKKERSLYRKSKRYLPDDPNVIVRQALLSFTEKDTVEATRHIEKFKTVIRKRGFSEAHLSKRLGDIYT